LFDAAVKGNVSLLRSLLQQHDQRRHVNRLDNDGFGILHSVAVRGIKDEQVAADVVEVLVSAGADVNLRNKVQETPLMITAHYGHHELAAALLKAGAKVDVCDWTGKMLVSVAKGKCSSKRPLGRDDADHQKYLELIELALEKERSDTKNKRRAENTRVKGNTAFGKQDYDKAIELYTQSLDAMLDYRTFGNRAQCHLEKGKALIRMCGYYTVERQVYALSEAAMLDASKATEQNPTYDKGWYRLALGHIGMKDFPRAKQDVKSGLKHCPDNTSLQLLMSKLVELQVGDSMANPFSEAMERATHALQSKAYTKSIDCQYCGGTVPILNEEDSTHCVFCACPLNNGVTRNDVIVLIYGVIGDEA